MTKDQLTPEQIEKIRLTNSLIVAKLALGVK